MGRNFPATDRIYKGQFYKQCSGAAFYCAQLHGLLLLYNFPFFTKVKRQIEKTKSLTLC